MGDEKHTIWEIETYIREGGGEYVEWYVGTADDPIDPAEAAFRLRKVRGGRFMYIETGSEEAALATANHFVNYCGTDGNLAEIGAGGPGRALYVYKKVEQLVTCQVATSL